tara:strand:+ start:2927 stop:3796 length:870 start_codon:yes stop_codon:yes gene_type:complete
MAKLAKLTVGGKSETRIMGIINTSPESFYKNSVMTTKSEISKTVKIMEDDGANIIDVGGMSTAPYLKTKISEREEEKRVIKAIKIIQDCTNLPISIDTCRSKVAQSALELGVEIINDVSGLKFDKDMPEVIERFQPSVIVCAYSNKIVGNNHVIQTKNLLQESIKIARKSNIPKNRIVVDPAIGFFRKSGTGFPFTKIRSNWVSRDLAVIANLRFIKSSFPALISVSNKSFIGEILQKEVPSDRLYGTLAAEMISIISGADILRTHNVAATKDILKISNRMLKNTKKGL